MRTTPVGRALCVTAVTFALASTAHATTSRTFVSGIGLDSNTSMNCARATPCRSLAAALTVTESGGTITAIDAAGYGTITITGPLSLLGVPGASISVASGGAGVTITAGNSNIIVISGFEINGFEAPNTTGIQVNSGKLILENSNLKFLTTGLIVSSTHADVINTDIVGNTTGIQTNGVGVPYNTGADIYLVNSPPYTTLVRIAWGSNVDNTTAFTENNPTSTGTSPNIQPSMTIWILNQGTSSGGMTNNLTGYTTLLSTTGTGATATNLGPQSYFEGQAPN